jgi:uncharacterized protein (DUF779 family)
VSTDSVTATEAALAELASLRERHGPLMLFQSGGCCDGSSPLCLHEGELLVGTNDLLLGEIGGTPLYIDAEQYERWNRPVFQIDLSPGASDTLSLEGPDDVHFITRTTTCARPQQGAVGQQPRPPSPYCAERPVRERADASAGICSQP